MQITLADLKLETHHRGCFLTARTVSLPYESIDVISVIEDEHGDVARLVLGYQGGLELAPEISLPLNSTVAVKEPYCKSTGEGEYVIRVDHPSDIAVLRGDGTSARGK